MFPTAKDSIGVLAAMRRRRFLRLLGAALAGGATLASCSAASSPVTGAARSGASTAAARPAVGSTTAVTTANAATAAPAAGQQTVQWLMRTQTEENAWEEKLAIPKFQALHPTLKVELMAVPFKDVDPKLTALVSSGLPPDVFSQFGASGFADYLARGLLRDLTPLIARDHFNMGSFLKGIPELYQRDGKYDSMPQVTNFGEVMLYNMQLFDAAGLPYPPVSWDDAAWTWDAMLGAARRLTRNAGQGSGAQYGADLGTLRNVYMAAYLWGGDAWPQELYQTGLAQVSQLTTPEVISATQAVADAYFKQQVAPTADDAKALTPTGDVFATGKVGMTISLLPAAYRGLKAASFPWGIAPLPRQLSSKHSVFNGCWFIEQESKHLDAAWEFVTYLVGDTNATDMGNVAGFVVPLQTAVEPWLKLFEAPTGMKSDDLHTVVLGSDKDAVENTNHLFVDWTEISQTLSQGTADLWQNKTDAKTALSRAQGPVDAVLAKTYATYHK